MAFTGNEGEVITLTEASELTRRYQLHAPDDAVKGVFIGTNKINLILNQADCVGIRCYFGEDDTGAMTVVMVGADLDENDIDTGVMIDRGVPCPPHCGASDPLNS